MKTFEFQGNNCYFELGTYASNGALSIYVKGDVDALGIIIIGCLTVNVTPESERDPFDSSKLPTGVFYAANWAMNEELYKFLIKEGLIEEVSEIKPCPYYSMMAPACRLTPKGKECADEPQP